MNSHFVINSGEKQDCHRPGRSLEGKYVDKWFIHFLTFFFFFAIILTNLVSQLANVLGKC